MNALERSGGPDHSAYILHKTACIKATLLLYSNIRCPIPLLFVDTSPEAEAEGIKWKAPEFSCTVCSNQDTLGMSHIKRLTQDLPQHGALQHQAFCSPPSKICENALNDEIKNTLLYRSGERSESYGNDGPEDK